MKIKFSSPVKEYISHPYPSLKNIPEGYKKLSKYINNNLSKKTVKGCVPFLDALTCGYIIPFPFDIYFWYDSEKNEVSFLIPEILQDELREFGVSSHPDFQVSKEVKYNKRTVENVFKFQNPWSITTPSGYSCIFTSPFNRNLPFKIIDGIVDTDQYKVPVNFPFYWTGPHNESLLLKQGTPMVLIIPFKRDNWKSEVVYEDKNVVSEIRKKTFTTFIDTYKNMFWRKKSYK